MAYGARSERIALRLPANVRERLKDRPTSNGFDLDAVPKYMRLLPCWNPYKIESRKDLKKPAKVPYDAETGRRAKTNAAEWHSFNRALSAYLGGGYDGLGFLFRKQDGLVGVDLDRCRDSDSGAIQPCAEHLINSLCSYTEVSPSGTGFHIICRGALPEDARARSGPVEIYNHGRFFTVTGNIVGPSGLEDRTELLALLVTALPALGGVVQNAKGAALFAGDVSEYESASEADLALCSYAAKHAKDEAVVAAVLLLSGLARAKHDRDDYISRTVAKALEAKDDKHSPSTNQATRLVELAGDAELFHTPQREAFATIRNGDHCETYAVQSGDFRHWLTHQFYRKGGKTPGTQPLQEALNSLRAMAKFDGATRQINVRVAASETGIVLDLANERWEAIEIDPEGWRVIADPGVRFRRAYGMQSLPQPVKAKGALLKLRKFVNVVDEDWPLVLGWLVAALHPAGPYPVLVLMGEQGSAKSTTARVLRSLVDPNNVALRAPPREEHSLMIAAQNSWINAFDNLSRVSADFSDSLCRLATGGGLSKRELYTDKDEVLLDARRPVMLNGIEELVNRGDLLERSILLYLPPIDSATRRTEEDFWAEFDQARPAILGSLLSAASVALRRLPTVKLERLPRMADFARWAVAAEPGLELEDGDFGRAYARNTREASDLALEAAPVAVAIRAFMETRRTWRGTATQLHQTLEMDAHVDPRRRGAWPKSAATLSNAVRRSASNLRRLGIEIRYEKEGRMRQRMIVLERDSATPSAPSGRPQDKDAR